LNKVRRGDAAARSTENYPRKLSGPPHPPTAVPHFSNPESFFC